MTVILPVRVSEMRAKIVEVMVNSMIATDTPVYTMYPTERHPKPIVGVKITIPTAPADIPHWRMRAMTAALNIETRAPGGNTVTGGAGSSG